MASHFNTGLPQIITFSNFWKPDQHTASPASREELFAFVGEQQKLLEERPKLRRAKHKRSHNSCSEHKRKHQRCPPNCSQRIADAARLVRKEDPKHQLSHEAPCQEMATAPAGSTIPNSARTLSPAPTSPPPKRQRESPPSYSSALLVPPGAQQVLPSISLLRSSPPLLPRTQPYTQRQPDEFSLLLSKFFHFGGQSAQQQQSLPTPTSPTTQARCVPQPHLSRNSDHHFVSDRGQHV